MEDNKREFLGTLCCLFMAAVLVGVPLYTGGTYFQIGDTKYIFFRNISFICMGLWIVVGIFAGVVDCLTGARKKVSIRWSIVDTAMLLYGACVLLSALCSPYENSPWTGYREWYMGAISQFLFIGIYFFVSRQYDGQSYPLYLGETALFLVVGIGLLNRLGVDPLHLFYFVQENEWEYSHMLSTIGNINWLCGYLGMALVIPISRFLDCDKGVRSWILFGINVLGMLLLCIQGSETGPVLAVVILLICLLMGSRKPKYFEKGLWLAAGTALGIPIMKGLIVYRNSLAAMPHDGKSRAVLMWRGWWVVAAVLLAGGLFLHFYWRGLSVKRFSTKEDQEKKAAVAEPENTSETDVKTDQRKAMALWKAAAGVAIVVGIAVMGAAGYYIIQHPVNDVWGSDRGALWRTAWEGFLQASGKQKLIGAGPDCFAEYLQTVVTTEGHWLNAIYANAHNEWLNQLINIGLLGMCSYFAVFVCGFTRYRRMLPGVFAIVLYLVNSLVSFQQVLNAPILFLLLGVCESRCRRILPGNH